MKFPVNAAMPMQPLFDILLGPVKMAVLDAALELHIADLLEKTGDVDAMAQTLGLKAGSANLGYLLDAMVSLKITRKKNGTYANTAFAKRFLTTESPAYLGDLVKNLAAMQHRNLNGIVQCVKNGPSRVQEAEDLGSELKWKNAVRHLAGYQRAGFASFAADLVESLPEFASASRIMDLGCGPGLVCMEILKRHPGLEGVLCDLPAIVDAARDEVLKEGLQSRISFIGGDYNDTELDGGYDIIWASHNLYYVREPVPFFRRVLKAMAPDGVFIGLHEGYTHERTEPAPIVLARLSLALEGQDVSFEKGEIAAHLRAAGFAQVESRTLQLPVGENELVIARKRRRGPR